MSRIPRTALALVLAAYLLPLAVPSPLMEDDEGLHAAIAQEMVERGDWTVPRLFGEPFLDKPILYFWLQAASLSLFGDSELAVRLPGTLTALAGVAAVAWLGRLLFGPATAVWAALCYATMLLPYGVSLAPLHDLVVVPPATVAVGAYWQARGSASLAALALWTMVAGVALGLAILGKGLTGVGLAGLGVAAWLVWTRSLSWRLVAVGAVSVAIGAAIAWPWYAAMERAVPGYLQYYFAERHLAGVTADTQRHAGRPFWYYLPIVVAGTWPWIVTLVDRVRARSDAERLAWAWLIADLVFLSLAGSKLATYLLPALPAAALLCAAAIAARRADCRGSEPGSTGGRGSERSGFEPFWPGLELAAILTAVLGMLAIPAAAWWLEQPVPAGRAVAVAVLLASVAWASRRTGMASPVRLAVVTAAVLATVAVTALPMVADRLTARPLAARINADGRLPAQLLIVDEGIGSFVFYLRPDLRRGLTPGRVQRISRLSLGDVAAGPDTQVAMAADRLPGVLALYDLAGPAPGGDEAFVVRPLAAFTRRGE